LKYPAVSVSFSEFSKNGSEKWKTMPAKEEGHLEDVAKADRLGKRNENLCPS
jgi:hypothetical protein